jgi:thioredoxin-related protein
MKRISSVVALGGLVLIAGFSCLSSKKAQSESLDEKAEPVQTIVPDTFVLPLLPETMKDPEERAGYLMMHYWDRFDFTDRELVLRPEITEQALVDYINIFAYAPKESIDASLVYTLQKAETDTMTYTHFTKLFEKYFYDPNSPFRNEEYYIPVLQEAVNSPLLAEENRSRCEFQLEMALKNRVGQRANDFRYTLSSEKSFRLYDLRSEYTLLMFTDPGCSTCAAVTEHLGKSKELNDALAKNSPTHTMFTILALYPEDNLQEWSAHLPEIPAGWVYAYDKSGEIIGKKLYDVRAFPTLYLLDRDKKVILKDTSEEAIESFFSVHP